ncbi:uncharacterized protein OCT59_002714 [Rhizophagus irregularis]|uniref:uncharacterized protein n=1 Tax=Rhizophagus irregularis TaxID=588596 RepID=UPI00331F193A|nr:hypothetical protein OCT59_002714 [Rhizophagus irregularis]
MITRSSSVAWKKFWVDCVPTELYSQTAWRLCVMIWNSWRKKAEAESIMQLRRPKTLSVSRRINNIRSL